MRSLRLLLLLASLLFLVPYAGAEPIKFTRYPHIANDGRIAFTYHGDIWIVDRDGSHPRRLTAHIARDTFPRFSPDGQWIAFDSDRMGNDDIWIIPAAGGVPRQLTLATTDDHVLYWTPDGTGVVMASSRCERPWGSPLYIVPLDGHRPEPLPMDKAAAGMIRQDGRMVAFNRRGFRYWRKHYRGNNNTDIWVQDLETRRIRQLTDLDLKKFREHTQDAFPMWGADGMIYFMSERDGIFNIWKIAPKGGEPVQVTFHVKDGVQFPAISPDGKTIIYENEFQLWTLEIPDGKPQKVEVDLAFDPKENRVTFLTVENEADGFTPSPDGESVAVDAHGEIFIVPVDPETGEKTRVTASPWRDRYEKWSPGGRHIAYISDESLEEEIWLYDVEQETRRKLTNQASVKSNLLWAPDGKRILFTAEKRIFLADVETGETVEVAHNEEGGFSVQSFSKDGRWLCYTRSDENLNRDVYLFDIEARKEYDVTPNPASDSGGYLTPDGKTVIFRSDREDGEDLLYALSLTPLKEDPDDPQVKRRKKKRASRAKKKAAEKEKEEETAEGMKKPKPLKVEIVLEGIDRRPRKLTKSGVRSFFLSRDGKTVYFTRSGGLYSVPVEGGAEHKVADGSFGRIRVTPDCKYLFYSEGGVIHRMSLGGRKKDKVSFTFQVKVDRRAEWEQIFEEAWRVMKYRFYDEKMHGFDWAAIKAQYKPLLRFVGENQDLYDLCNEMIGELNASHTGVSGPPTRTMERYYTTRSPGFEMEIRNGYWCVSHIYWKGPADKEWLDLKEGDYVLSMEGRALRAGDNYYDLLNHLLNEYVDIEAATPKSDGSPGPKRKLRIRTVTSLRDLKYEEWVHKNREFVDAYSKGKIGYVHIRSMSGGPLRRFKREIDRYWNKNGMIIDIRYNGGGNIDQELIDILERRPYEYWNYRMGGRAWGRRPRQAIAGPKVMLVNWRSASDSEVTPQAFRDLGLGRIVGNPTYGAVIATGSYRLINGARIRTPGSLVTTYDPTKPHNYGINLENFGVAPDVWVENTPEDELKGFDRELAAAVDEALRMLKEGTWQYGEDD